MSYMSGARGVFYLQLLYEEGQGILRNASIGLATCKILLGAAVGMRPHVEDAVCAVTGGVWWQWLCGPCQEGKWVWVVGWKVEGVKAEEAF